MKKNSGIVRNKNAAFHEAKSKIQRKKSRFQSMNKNDESFETSTPNSTSDQGIIMASSAFIESEGLSCKTVYEKAKKKLAEVSDIRKRLLRSEKKMSNLSKARLTSFKQKQYEKYDESISKLASEATNLLVEAEKCMKQMSQIPTSKDTDKKLIENMGQSLAVEIRETSRSLRQQQKQYFDTIRQLRKDYQEQSDRAVGVAAPNHEGHGGGDGGGNERLAGQQENRRARQEHQQAVHDIQGAQQLSHRAGFADRPDRRQHRVHAHPHQAGRCASRRRR